MATLPFGVILLSRCPQCGKGKLYKGLLSFNKECSACAYDYTQLETDDGAAAFVILFVGALASVAVFLVEVYIRPPYWNYLVYGVPLLVLASLYAIRVVTEFFRLYAISLYVMRQSLFYLALFFSLVCFGLGFWQWQRLAWKEDLISQIETKCRDSAPLALPPQRAWRELKQDNWVFQKIVFSGAVLDGTTQNTES